MQKIAYTCRLQTIFGMVFFIFYGNNFNTSRSDHLQNFTQLTTSGFSIKLVWIQVKKKIPGNQRPDKKAREIITSLNSVFLSNFTFHDPKAQTKNHQRIMTAVMDTGNIKTKGNKTTYT